nr:hypothetical protein [uncultured Lichenicoccus sp.]
MAIGEPDLSGQPAIFIGGESIPFTMQVEVSHEATASDLTRMPDEPGMVRIPITLDVMIPSDLLAAAQTAGGAWGPGTPTATAGPGADRRHRRGRFPGSAGSAISGSSLRATLGPAANEGRAAFRDMSRAARSGPRQSVPNLPVVERIDITDVEPSGIVARSAPGEARGEPAAHSAPALNAAGQASQFAHGFGKGLRDGAAGTVEGSGAWPVGLTT